METKGPENKLNLRMIAPPPGTCPACGHWVIYDISHPSTQRILYECTNGHRWTWNKYTGEILIIIPPPTARTSKL